MGLEGLRRDVLVSHELLVAAVKREHEVELATKWRDEGDDRAMHELVMAYARIVVSAAARYRYYGLSNGDLIQEGNIGWKTRR